MRWMTCWSLLTTTRRSARPAPTMATWGGTTTRLAKRPPIIPKFERVIVAPRSSSGGIERAAASAFERLRRPRFCQAARGALDIGARDHPASATALHEVKIDIELARQSPNRGEHLQPFGASWRLDLARRLVALNLTDDCAGVRIGFFAVLN